MSRQQKKEARRERRHTLLQTWIRLYGVKEARKMARFGMKHLQGAKKLIRHEDVFADSDDHEQMRQLLQLQKEITEQNWLLIRQNEQMLRQNDEIISLMKRLRVMHHSAKKNNK